MDQKNNSSSVFSGNVSRRGFLHGAACTAALFSIVPRHVLGGNGYVPPSDKLRLACIGVGAQGTRVMTDFLKEPDVQVVAVCDVNQVSSDYSEWDTNELRNRVREVLGDPNWGSQFKGPTAGREPAKNIVEAYYAKHQTSGQYRGCAAYNDFRELLSKGRDFDGVVVCTPDHWHAPISIAAMRGGKHVYCQKPMTHTIEETRQMAEVARQNKVVTQVALSVSASEDTRLLSEWISAGVIGPVRRVENWSTRPFWPQGLNRPEKVDPVPPGLDWNLWLGPAPERPFNHAYLPFVWRGWYDFGTGAIGDMGQYSFDTLFRVLKLAPPTSVDATSTQRFKETFPAASIIRFEFAARGNMPPVTLTWYDGDLKPQRPPEFEDGRKLGDAEDGEGLLFIGDHGTILAGFEGGNPRLIPESKMKAFQPPPKTLPRSIGHYREFIEACKGGSVIPAANFEFESRVTEAVLLGNISLRSGEMVRWDSGNMKITNAPAAQPLVFSDYRPEWKAFSASSVR